MQSSAPETAPPVASDRAARWSTLLALGAAVIAATARKLGDFDLPWHLAAGRAMLATHSLIRRDDFSYTFHGGRPFYAPLAEIALYLAHSVGGVLGLHGLALLTVTALAWSLTLRADRAARSLALAVASLALLAAAPWLVVRPALFSFPLFSMQLGLLAHHRHERRPRSLLTAVVVQVVWANLHGFAVLGAALGASYAAYTVLCRVARDRAGHWLAARDGADASRVVMFGAAMMAATCASPEGLRLFTVPFAVRGHDVMVTEWAHTTLTFVVQQDPAFGIFVIASFAALAWGREERGTSAFDLCVLAGTLVLACLRVRLIPLFVVASAPWIANRLWPRIERARMRTPLVVLVAAAVVPAIVVSPATRAGLGFDAKNLPIGAVDFLGTHLPAGPMWNFLPFGGTLIWRLYPRARVFVDGRTATLYPPQFLDAYARAEHDPAAFDALERRYGFSWAVVRAAPGERFDEPIAGDAAWTMIYLDDSAAVYVRRDGRDATMAGAGYRVLRHLTPPGLLLLRPPPLEDLAHDAVLAVAQDRHSPRAHFVAAAADGTANDWAGAHVERDRIAALDPDYPGLELLDAWMAAREPRRSQR